MRELIDLFPGAKPSRWVRLERACEEIEARDYFTVRDIQRFVSYSTAVQAIREFRRYGLIEPVDASAKPITYRVAPTKPSHPCSRLSGKEETMDTFTTAPEAMFTAVAQGSLMDLAALGALCRGCQTPFAEWDTLHPLFRSWSGKCPDCHTRDIQLDFAHQNQES